MGRQTSSATDGGQEEPWAKLISAWESLAASTRDETLLADLLALLDERAGILKHVHLLSVR